MSIRFVETPARAKAWTAMRRTAAEAARAEEALTSALAYLETHRRPDVYSRVNQARDALRTARRAYDRADARWLRA